MQNLENFQNKQPTRFLNDRLPPAGVFIAKMKGLLEFDQQILGVDLGAGRDMDRFDLGVTFGVKAAPYPGCYNNSQASRVLQGEQ